MLLVRRQREEYRIAVNDACTENLMAHQLPNLLRPREVSTHVADGPRDGPLQRSQVVRERKARGVAADRLPRGALADGAVPERPVQLLESLHMLLHQRLLRRGG